MHAISDNLPVTGNTERTRPENHAFYPALDGFRAVAFLMVYLQHYWGMPWGWTGVDFFFVLSGFLITGILFDTRHDTHRARNFYARRTLRIFPLYYGIMLALLLLTPIVHWQRTWAWLVWPAYLGNFLHDIRPLSLAVPFAQVANFQLHGTLFRHGFVLYLGHFWSLCVEEQFYLIWPWVMFAILDRRRLIYLCAATLPICLALRLLGNHYMPASRLQDGFLYNFTPLRLDALLLGGLLALCLRGPNAKTLLRAARFALPCLIAAIVLLFAFTRLHRVHDEPYPYPYGMYTWCLTIADLLAALLILVTIQPGTILYKLLKVRPLRWIGRISYGAYVLHDIPHFFYNAAGKRLLPSNPKLGSTLIALPCTLALAWLSFHFFESRFLNLKERWTVRGERHSPQPQDIDSAPLTQK
ncbi:MAG: acyltransferase [Acidobacteria bacterium]|nr:acyltransferase [Acidobacteriota bacterium]